MIGSILTKGDSTDSEGAPGHTPAASGIQGGYHRYQPLLLAQCTSWPTLEGLPHRNEQAQGFCLHGALLPATNTLS